MSHLAGAYYSTEAKTAIARGESRDPESIDVSARAPKKTSGFACNECGHKFRTIKAAEKAAFGPDGCPKCGGADIERAP